MDLSQLKDQLGQLADNLSEKDRNQLNAQLKHLLSAPPFNEYEYSLMFLFSKGIITFKEYEKLRNEYISSNKYLVLYGLAPRIFGEIWGHDHIRELDKRFKKPNKSIDPKYKGQYDLWIEGVRVELKAARAINTKKRGDLVSKALQHSSKESFWMNFQQIKLDIADIFVFIGVWANQIIYWVLTNEEVKNNNFLSHQHRGGIEYQIGITEKNISDFDKYMVAPDKLADTIIKKNK